MKRRIAVFSVDYFPYVGGAEVAVRETCRRLPRYAFTVITCRNDRSLPRVEHDGAATIIRVGFGIRRIDKYLFPALAPFVAFRIHAREPFSGIWGIMANTAGLAALLFHIAYPRPFYALSVQEGDSDAEYRARTWFWFPLFRAVHSRADIVMPISDFLERRVRESGYSGEIAVIPNGVDLALFRPVPGAPRPPHHAIVSVSRLVSKNGLPDLVRAFALVRAEYPDATLSLVGDGEDRGPLSALAREEGVERHVIFAGGVPHAAIPDFLRSSDLFVRPSLSEGFGNAFVEAMACGVPVIGTSVGAIPELIDHGKSGLLSPPGDPASLARAIIRIFSDLPLREMCVAGGLQTASRHSWDAIAERIGICFDSLV